MGKYGKQIAWKNWEEIMEKFWENFNRYFDEVEKIFGDFNKIFSATIKVIILMPSIHDRRFATEIRILIRLKFFLKFRSHVVDRVPTAFTRDRRRAIEIKI